MIEEFIREYIISDSRMENIVPITGISNHRLYQENLFFRLFPSKGIRKIILSFYCFYGIAD